MRRALYIILFIWAITGNAIAQETYMYCDFEHGIPGNFSVFRMNGQRICNDNSWTSYKITSENNKTASSTPLSAKASNSVEYMITCSFVVKSSKAVLRWNSCASGNKSSSGYSVIISDKGNRPSDFKGKHAVKVKNENKSWSRHEISLAAYKGKRIWIAFVCSCSNRICIDELYSGVPSSKYLLS